MRDVVCPHCQQTVPAPDGLDQAHCVRCGQAFALADTRITAEPAPRSSQAYQAEALLDKRPGGTFALPERWSTWDEFRSNSPAVQRELMQLATRAMPDMRNIPTQPLPEDAPGEVDGWGQPLGTIEIPGYGHSAMLDIVIALFIGGGILLIVFGAVRASPLFNQPGQPVRDAGFVCVGYGVMAAFIGIVIWWAQSSRSQLPTTLWIFEEGVYLRRFGRSMSMRWDDVKDFETSTGTGRPLYWLSLTHDLSVTISIGFSPQVIPLMEYVEIRLAASQFLKRLESIWEGRRERFGCVALDRQGFAGPRLFARWADVRRVISDSNNLFVDWSGESEWHALRYRDVSFPYLVMAIAHVMIDEHKRFAKLEA